MEEKHYDFFQNKFANSTLSPGADPETFSCLFCYCPLYALGDRCRGASAIRQTGVKDCTHCLRPHVRENYGKIFGEDAGDLELAKKKRGGSLSIIAAFSYEMGPAAKVAGQNLLQSPQNRFLASALQQAPCACFLITMLLVLQTVGIRLRPELWWSLRWRQYAGITTCHAIDQTSSYSPGHGIFCIARYPAGI